MVILQFNTYCHLAIICKFFILNYKKKLVIMLHTEFNFIQMLHTID
jgi:hypothetical protein